MCSFGSHLCSLNGNTCTLCSNFHLGCSSWWKTREATIWENRVDRSNKQKLYPWSDLSLIPPEPLWFGLVHLPDYASVAWGLRARMKRYPTTSPAEKKIYHWDKFASIENALAHFNSSVECEETSIWSQFSTWKIWKPTTWEDNWFILLQRKSFIHHSRPIDHDDP